MDPYLINVSERVKSLERELSDALWEEDPRSEMLEHELQYYQQLALKGQNYEPTF